MKHVFRSFDLLILVVLIFSYKPIFPAQPPSQRGIPHLMPPNPRLYDDLQSGDVQLPRFMTDPVWAQSVGLEGSSVDAASTTPISGTLNVLAVAIDFSDKVHTVTATAFDSLLFAAPRNGFGSVRDYYNEISYGRVDLVTVNLPSSMGWKRMSNTYAYYTNGQYCTGGTYPHNCQKLAEDVINAIDGVVDFKKYDNNGDGIAEPIVIIHAGEGAEFSNDPNDIWSHSWNTNTPLTKDGVKVSSYTIQPEYWDPGQVSETSTDMSIGVFAHEMGHGFWNLPDLYDRNEYNVSAGIGNFDLMATGSWNGPDSKGEVPAWPSAWSRIQMGFAAPTLITKDALGLAVPQPYDSTDGAVLKLNSPKLHDSREYYLVENRETAADHYDQYLPAGGLFIWHIDERMNTSSNQNDYNCINDPQSACDPDHHFLVSLMQADGQHNLDRDFKTDWFSNRGDGGDPYPGGSGNRDFANTTYPESGSWYNTLDSGIRVTNISDPGATMTADFSVPHANHTPVAQNDSYNLNEDDLSWSAAAPGVLSNDTDVDNDPLYATKVSNPSHGTLAFHVDGSFSYKPYHNWNGTDSFTYKINDGKINSNTATVKLIVQPVQDPPIAANDAFTGYEDKNLTVSAPGLLSNDKDIDGDALTALPVTGPEHGTLALNLDGSFTYTPAANYNGPDSFTYKANDGGRDSNAATVSILLRAVNDAPVAVNDSLDVDEDSVLTLPAPGVLGNDTDAEGNRLTAVRVTGTAHGTLTLNSNGSLSYKPAANWNGTDSFTYKAKDSLLASKVATVTIIVHPVNDAPVAVGDSYILEQDTTLDVPAPGPLANDRDRDRDPLNAIVSTTTVNGKLALNADGSFSYVPDAGFYGQDSFTYHVNDGTLDSNTVTVALTITKFNFPPIAVEDHYTIKEDRSLEVAAPGLLRNDSDPEGRAIRAVLITRPAHGALSFRPNGYIYYKPARNWNGDDSFTYKATDGVKFSEPTRVTITINPVNDVPVAVNDFYTTDLNVPLDVSEPGVLANDKEYDGEALTATLARRPAYGTLTFNGNGSFTYIPKTYFLGYDNFTYRVSDGTFNSTVVTVTIKVKRPVYTFSGFIAPVDNRPAVNLMTAGDRVPVRFSLGGDRGLLIFARGFPNSSRVTCPSAAPVAQVEETTGAGAALTYDLPTDQYTYIWVTNPTWAGTCRKFNMLLSDGKVYSALFKFQ